MNAERDLMGRIFLLENSLFSAGTHHFDLVECLALGARSLGIPVHIASNKKFRPDTSNSIWKSTRPTFAETLYQPYSSLAGIRQMQRVPPLETIGQSKSHSLWQRWRSWARGHREQSKVERHVAGFARECEEFFQSHPLTDGDHVILPTISDLELLGSLRFLSGDMHSRGTTWSFILHFCAFSGRPENYQSQLKALSGLREQIQAGLEQLPFHQLRFFATTSALVEQYSRLGLPNVEEFHYPASAEFFASTSTPDNKPIQNSPLRFVVAGGVRREKGQAEILNELNRLLEVGEPVTPNVRWVFQVPRRAKWRTPKLKIPEKFPPSSVEFAPHPLPKSEYVDLIKGADVGILLYDRERYFARCAGVLGEFFATGKPVITSAGCWLGDQLNTAAQDHAQNLLRQFPIVQEFPVTGMTWLTNNVPQAGGVWSYDGTGHPFEATFDVHSDTGGIVVEFEWHSPKTAGSHCQWDLLVGGAPVGLSRVVSFDSNRKKSHLFFPVPGGAERVTLRLQNSFARSTQSVRQVNVYGLGQEVSDCPISACGVAIATNGQLGLAVQELQRHFRHYQETAKNMSCLWRERNSPQASLGQLLTVPQKQIMTA